MASSAVFFAVLAVLSAALAVVFAESAVVFAVSAVVFAVFAVFCAALALLSAELAALSAALALLSAELAALSCGNKNGHIGRVSARGIPECYWSDGSVGYRQNYKVTVYPSSTMVAATWNKELARIGIDVMITGHLHRLLVLGKNDERALRPNPYPIIVGARPDSRNNCMVGTALTLYPDRLEYKFTDNHHEVVDAGSIRFAD